LTPALITLADDAGRPWIHAIFGAEYDIDPRGEPLERAPTYALVEECLYYTDLDYPGRYRPSLLCRDIEALPRLRGTDVVVQGVWRSDKRVSRAACRLTCRGAVSFSSTIALFGDRYVERGRTGVALTAPDSFTELPLRLDRAYGGTDERAAEHSPDPDEEALRGLISDEEFFQSSTYSYPRNPAGRGYLVDSRGLIGAPLPNLEWPDDLLTVDRMVAPLEQWGARPTPACFDFTPHAFFPRVAFFGAAPPTHDGRLPAVERDLEILPADLYDRPVFERPSDAYFQSAQPHLWRHRLRGDEALTITGASRDGRDAVVRLPGVVPYTSIAIGRRAPEASPASLDLVLIQTETSRLTMIWRSSSPCEDPMALAARRIPIEASINWRSAR
jgi:hypothetical protein